MHVCERGGAQNDRMPKWPFMIKEADIPGAGQGAAIRHDIAAARNLKGFVRTVRPCGTLQGLAEVQTGPRCFAATEISKVMNCGTSGIQEINDATKPLGCWHNGDQCFLNSATPAPAPPLPPGAFRFCMTTDGAALPQFDAPQPPLPAGQHWVFPGEVDPALFIYKISTDTKCKDIGVADSFRSLNSIAECTTALGVLNITPTGAIAEVKRVGDVPAQNSIPRGCVVIKLTLAVGAKFNTFGTMVPTAARSQICKRSDAP